MLGYLLAFVKYIARKLSLFNSQYSVPVQSKVSVQLFAVEVIYMLCL